MALIIRRSSIHSLGCYTTAPIRKGQRVIEYTGPRISSEEADRRHDGEVTYLFGLAGGKTVIDGRGKAARINHSCAPNCEAVETGGRVWIVALRNIKAGEELSYDYALYDGDGVAPCRCGARRCRGTMYAAALKPRPRRRRSSARGRKTQAQNGKTRKTPARKAPTARRKRSALRAA